MLLAGLSHATRIELRKVGAGRWLIIASAAVGLMVAVIVGLTAEGLTFSLASFYVQSSISLPLPFVSIGIVLSVLVTNFAPAAAAEPWHGIGMIMIGSALVQLIAQLTGAGFGLLLRSNLAAMVADVAVPLGLWLVSGDVIGLPDLQVWSLGRRAQRRWMLRLIARLRHR